MKQKINRLILDSFDTSYQRFFVANLYQAKACGNIIDGKSISVRCKLPRSGRAGVKRYALHHQAVRLVYMSAQYGFGVVKSGKRPPEFIGIF